MIAPSALRALAQQATKGPWRIGGNVITDDLDVIAMENPTKMRYVVARTGRRPDDAAFIAACDPQTILALLDAVEALERIGEACQYPEIGSRGKAIRAGSIARAALAPFTETQT